MKAQELIEKFVKEEHQAKASVLGLLEDGNWYHIHRDEVIPPDHRPVIAVRDG